MAKKAKKDSEEITIVGLEGRHLYRLEAFKLEISPDGGIKQITGLNKEGKTALLKILSGNIRGGKQVHAGIVNRDSPDGTGESRVTFSNGYVSEKRHTPGDPKGSLKVMDPNGLKGNQSTLNEWLGGLPEPLAFFNLSEEEQGRTLLGLGTDPELPEKLGENRGEVAALKEERTPLNRTIQKAERTQRPVGDRPEVVDVSAQMERLDEMEGVQASREDGFREADGLKERSERLKQQAREKWEEVEKLQEGLRFAEQAAVGLDREGARLWDEAQQKNGETVEQYPDLSEEIEEVREVIRGAKKANEAMEPWREHDRIQEEATEARKERTGLESRIKVLKEAERGLMAEAGIEIDGLTFSEDGAPRLWDQPLALASGRERVEFAVAVSFADNPKLKVVLVDEGFSLDKVGMARLNELAKKKGFQIFLARIEAEGEGEVIICQDGKAWVKGEGEEDG